MSLSLKTAGDSKHIEVFDDGNVLLLSEIKSRNPKAEQKCSLVYKDIGKMNEFSAKIEGKQVILDVCVWGSKVAILRTEKITVFDYSKERQLKSEQNDPIFNATYNDASNITNLFVIRDLFEPEV